MNNIRKKALIVSPYLNHLGGGERYMLTAASVLEKLGYEIYFSWDNLEEINKLSSMLGIELITPRIDSRIKDLYSQGQGVAMYQATRPYDVVVYLSDGSLPLLGGKNNIVHMQVPFMGVGGRSWKNKLKKLFIHHVIVNSEFTKRVIDQEYNLASSVIYPPVEMIKQTLPKENLILSVGRFERSLNVKKQDVLIKAFGELSPQLPGWRLALAGGSENEAWESELKKMAGDLPIDFFPNIAYSELADLYSRARIYWHAAGYQVDEQKNPELTEHFGITTVEAISAGCIPLVVPSGGQREIVPDERYHWQDTHGLVEKTLALTLSPKPLDIELDKYSVTSFATKLKKIIK